MLHSLYFNLMPQHIVEIKQKIILARQPGKSLSEISNSFFLPRSTVSGIIYRYNKTSVAQENMAVEGIESRVFEKIGSLSENQCQIQDCRYQRFFKMCNHT